MPRNTPLLILEDVIIPTSETEIGLSSSEYAALIALTGGEEGIVAIVSRPPGYQPRTTLERKAAPDEPGAIMRSCVFGNARLLSPNHNHDSRDGYRLQLSDILRGRLADVRVSPAASNDDDADDSEDSAVWLADVDTWPLEGVIPEDEAVDELHRGFLRLLLATRDPEASVDDLRRQLGRPLRELSETQAGAARLWLLADYLFERPTMRAALLQSESAETLAATIADALEVAHSGIPVGPGQLARPLTATVAAASEAPVAQLEDLARIVQTYTPMVVSSQERGQALVEEAASIAQAAAELSRKVEKFVTKLAKTTARKHR